MLMLLYEQGQQREVEEGRLMIEATRLSVREGVADVLVPMLTGKQRRRPRGDGAPVAGGLTGAPLQRAVGLLGATMGGARNHPGLVVQGTPGHPFKSQVH